MLLFRDGQGKCSDLDSQSACVPVLNEVKLSKNPVSAKGGLVLVGQ